MASITLYHGSENVIQKPLFHAGNPKNDYGYGFYCTESIELAKEWASSEEKDGFANQYTLNTTGLSVLNLSDGKYNILNWLAILLQNRTFSITSDIAIDAAAYISENFLVQYEQFDIIWGYRADDSYFSFANAFLNNTISLKKLNKAMYLGKLGEQIVLKSKKAFSKIKYVTSFAADRSVYYPQKMNRDSAARKAFFEMRSSGAVSAKTGATGTASSATMAVSAANDIFVMDILRGGFKNDDPRIPAVLFE